SWHWTSRLVDSLLPTTRASALGLIRMDSGILSLQTRRLGLSEVSPLPQNLNGGLRPTTSQARSLQRTSRRHSMTSSNLISIDRAMGRQAQSLPSSLLDETSTGCTRLLLETRRPSSSAKREPERSSSTSE